MTHLISRTVETVSQTTIKHKLLVSFYNPTLDGMPWLVIKVDDGCYEVDGLDRDGHQVEAKFSRASLTILELDVKFMGSGDASDYLRMHKINLRWITTFHYKF